MTCFFIENIPVRNLRGVGGGNNQVPVNISSTSTSATPAPEPTQSNPIFTITDAPESFTCNNSDCFRGTSKYRYKKKQHVSLTGFSILSISGFCLSAHFILLMLLLTNKMCASKKKAPKLQSPAPISN
uniref:Uncharacterized protein n=1 Tax=Panagrolaimus superbus TaxID=310955 RepID=A0A914YUC2_9BILA